jgi:site-specific DNA recombinase
VLCDTQLQLVLDHKTVAASLGLPAHSRQAPILSVPAQLRSRGRELKFIVEGSSGDRPAQPDPALIKAIVKAHRWWEMLLKGHAATLNDIAKRENASGPYVRRLLELAFLAPDMAMAILDGRQPIDLTAETLTRCEDLPDRWNAQRDRFGFRAAS